MLFRSDGQQGVSLYSDSGILERMKELDPELETVFITHNLTKEQYVLDYADSYSIEAKNLSVEMVERLHAQDKSVYAWTVNDKYTMQRAVNCGVDGIVTDDVRAIQKYAKSVYGAWYMFY